MPLTFDVTKIKGYQESEYCEPPWDKTWHPVTSALVHCSTWVGMYEITEENHEKFFLRSRIEFLASGISGLVDTETMEARPFTLKDIKDHIGLRTNANPMSDREFRARTLRSIGAGSEKEKQAEWLRIKKQAVAELEGEKANV